MLWVVYISLPYWKKRKQQNNKTYEKKPQQNNKTYEKMRSLVYFIPFQDGLVLYTKYVMVNKGVYSVSLKNTTVRPAQVKLAHLQLPLQLYLSEWNLREVSVSNQTGRFIQLLIKFASPLVHLQHLHFPAATPMVSQWLQEGSLSSFSQG